MYLTIQGLVVRSTDYNDRDVLLTVLTREYGRITVKARGANRRNNPLSAACQLLTLSEFTLFSYRDTYVVNDANVVELFPELRADMQKLALATYMGQVSELISQEDCPNRELFSLLLNCLYGLARLGLPEGKVKSVFELRSACIAGFQPDLGSCSLCGTEDVTLFDISGGCLLCNGCKSGLGSGIRLPVTAGILAAMRYICYCEPKLIFRFSVGEDTMEALSHITEAYLITQLERGFSALDFYKSLLLDVT